MPKPKPRSYWPNCQVCQFMKKHKDFKVACMQSSYFDPNAQESLKDVHIRYGEPFKLPTLYRHMSRHQKVDIERSERLARMTGQPSKVWQRNTVLTGQKALEKVKEEKKMAELTNTQTIVEAPVEMRQPHEQALDALIALGQDRLLHNEIQITAPHLISAIKVKAEIERSTKDRRLEMLKTMFAGAAPKNDSSQS